MSLKEKLYNECVLYIERREGTVNTIISSNQKALTSETKSSAGDKHETGRAMLQLEMEKASQQLHGISVMKEILSKVDITKNSNIAHLGSVISTNKGNYFLSISAGQIKVDNELYFAISSSSPIGKLLLGKKIGESLTFNQNTIIIDTIF